MLFMYSKQNNIQTALFSDKWDTNCDKCDILVLLHDKDVSSEKLLIKEARLCINAL